MPMSKTLTISDKLMKRLVVLSSEASIKEEKKISINKMLERDYC